MSTSRRTRPSLARGAATVLLSAALPLALTACGAGFDATTYQERSQADATNTALGTLAIRGLAVLPAEDGRTIAAGEDAEAVLVVTNKDDEPDRLLEVTSPDAESVEVLVDDRPASLEVPALGSTENTARLRLVGLKEDLREGEYVTMTLRFERNGTLEVPVPVVVSGRTDRPVFTAEEGSEEEPALQAPAGGHAEEEHAEEEPGQLGAEGTAEGGTAVASEDESASPSPSPSGSPSGSSSPRPTASPTG